MKPVTRPAYLFTGPTPDTDRPHGLLYAARPERLARALLFAAWCAATLFLAARHDMWRDEVRAYSVALQGDTAAAMLHQLGEGHPALWYLLLRGAHAIWPNPIVLPVVAWCVASAAAALLAFRSPFRAWLIGLILFGGFGLFEYAVMARNYGISMAILFATAWRYPRRRGWELGILLALLANTNLHSAMLAGLFLFFWAIDARERWRAEARALIVAAALTVAGLLACLREIYPTVNDAIPGPEIARLSAGGITAALLAPARAFDVLAPAWPGAPLLVAALLLLAPLGLLRRPAAAITAALAVIGFELFFALAYPGSYRHAALLLVFLITLYWIAGAEARDSRHRVEPIGAIAFSGLLALQLPIALTLVSGSLMLPQSRVAEFAALLRREHLENAVVIGNPEANAEALPYYAANPIWLAHERRFGTVIHFTRAAARDLTLAQLLADGERLRRATGLPVVYAFRWPPNAAGPRVLHDSYVWSLAVSPADARAFAAATIPLARFGPALSGETFTAYRLR